MRSSDTTALPTLDLRALARRAALAAAVAAVAAVGLVVAGGPLQAFADALDRAIDADPRWIGAAAAFELLSFAGYVALLWLVGRRATRRLGLRESAEVSLGGAAATRLLPTGGVGGAALTVWAFRRAGLDGRAAARTLLAFLVVLYSVFLMAIAVAGGLLALGLVRGGGPFALTALPAIGAVVVIAGALALAARRPGADAPVAVATVADAPGPASGPGAARLARARAALGHAPTVARGAVRDALALVRSGDPRLLGAAAWWAFDGAVLWAMLHALGAPPPLAVLVLAYFVGQIANTIPAPGAASGGMVGVLLAFGVEADLALASVLAYRSVAIWLPAPLGLVALAGLRRTFARWAEEDAQRAPAAGRVPVAGPAPVAAPVPVAVPLPARHTGPTPRSAPVHLPVWPGRERVVQVPA
jgi:putative heme transporter